LLTAPLTLHAKDRTDGMEWKVFSEGKKDTMIILKVVQDNQAFVYTFLCALYTERLMSLVVEH
jgi:hypothetical protein